MTRTRQRSIALFLLACAVCAAAAAVAARFTFSRVSLTRHHALYNSTAGFCYLYDEWGQQPMEAHAKRPGPFESEAEPHEIGWAPPWYRFVPGNLPGPHMTWISVPHWVPIVLALVPATWLLLRTRKTLPNHCPHCHYNLTGLPPNSPCPECGHSSPAKEA